MQASSPLECVTDPREGKPWTGGRFAPAYPSKQHPVRALAVAPLSAPRPAQPPISRVDSGLVKPVSALLPVGQPGSQQILLARGKQVHPAPVGAGAGLGVQAWVRRRPAPRLRGETEERPGVDNSRKICYPNSS